MHPAGKAGWIPFDSSHHTGANRLHPDLPVQRCSKMLSEDCKGRSFTLRRDGIQSNLARSQAPVLVFTEGISSGNSNSIKQVLGASTFLCHL